MEFWKSGDELYFSILLDNHDNEDFPSRVKIMKAKFASPVEGTEIAQQMEYMSYNQN